jgi:hypothetical protein
MAGIAGVMGEQIEMGWHDHVGVDGLGEFGGLSEIGVTPVRKSFKIMTSTLEHFA